MPTSGQFYCLKMSQIPPTSSKKFQAITEPPRNHCRKNEFAQNFRVIYIVSRVLGLMPFTVAYNMNGEIEKPTVTKLDVLWFLTSICVYSLGIYKLSQLIFPRGEDIYTSPLVVLSDNMSVMLGLILGLTCSIFDMCNRHKLISIVKQFVDFDKKVQIVDFSQHKFL